MAVELTRQPIDIRYRHAGDGKLYEHRFSKGTRIRLKRDGTTELYNVAGKPTHTVRNGLPYLLNAPEERTSPRRRKSAMRRHRNRKGQFTKNPRHRKRRRPSSNPGRGRRRATTARNAPARRRRSRGRKNPYVVSHRVTTVPNPPRHRKRRAHRNPPEGMVKALGMEILANAGYAGVVLTGEFTAKNVPGWVNAMVGGNLPNNFFINAAFELLVGVGGGIGLSFAKQEIGAMWMIGGFLAVYRSILTGFAIPYVTAGLSGVTDRTAGSLRGYIATRRRAMNGYGAAQEQIQQRRRVAGYVGSPMTSSAEGVAHQQQGQQ